MKAVALTLALALGLAVPAFAQEEPVKDAPAKPEAVKEEAAKPEAAPEATPPPEPAKEEAPAEAAKPEAAKPAEEKAPAKAAAPAAAAAAAAPAKELSPCAKTYAPLADSYKAAYDDMQKWIAQIDAETSAAGEKAKSLQDQVQANETAITQAKLAGDDAKAKSLTKENKTLWTELNTAKQAQQKACSAYAKEAPNRVKQYADAANKALADVKAQAK